MERRGYFRRWLSQTLRDTKTYWVHGVILVIGTGVLSFLIQYVILGRELTVNEAKAWTIGTLVPAVIMGILFLFWNAILAPASLATVDAQELVKERRAKQD